MLIKDSFPQDPTVGTDKYVLKARLELPFHKACLFSLQFSTSPVTPLTACPNRGSGVKQFL